MRRIACLALAICLMSVAGAAQTVVAPLDNWTIRISPSDYRTSDLTVASLSGYDFRSGYLLFDVSEFPGAFDRCELQLYREYAPVGVAMVDVLAVPRPSSDTSYSYFTPNFQAPFEYCGSFQPSGQHQTDRIEIGNCIRAAIDVNAPFVIVQLSAALVPGGPATLSLFVPLFRYHPPSEPGEHEPRLVFTGVVPTKHSSLGGVKGLYR